ncbi:MAG TPA: orotidine-5'-phosphate decarboxylase [Bacteroidota bacterium]|nr:orotidine-5'-phosphate decarboxylase [Bacteroidota bacterium]
MAFSKKLISAQRKQGSLLCIGLDTDAALLPRHLGRSANAVLAFNRRIIDATADLVCAYKLNLAFYETLGAEGWRVMEKTLEHIPHNIITIGDGKRGDIGNTSECYAKALFDELGFDAATVNPYMGYDSVEPFLQWSGRGVFLLALTSNPGSNDVQRLRLSGGFLYEHVVRSAVKWNTKKNIGLVVGATHPNELRRIRNLTPEMPILIPGVGKQGGDLKSAIRYGCTKRGDRAIINASRSILYASRGKDFAQAARREAMRLRNEIEKYLEAFFK